MWLHMPLIPAEASGTEFEVHKASPRTAKPGNPG